MRKGFVFGISTLLLVGLTGCGSKNQLICTKSGTVEGVDISVEVTIDLDKDDKITDASLVYDIKDNDIASQFCETAKESYKKGVSCSGNKTTIKGLDNLENPDGTEHWSSKTKDDFIKKAESEGFTCKK